MFNRGPKLHVRLPSDDEHEPNPYDSKTNPKDLLKNRWLWDWKWWLPVIVLAVILYLTNRS